MLINKRKNKGLKYFDDPEAFIEYSNDMSNIYENIGEYNPNKKHKILIVFDEMVAGVLSDKELSPVAADVLISRRKLNTYLAFIKQSYFAAPKNVRLNSTH